MVAAKQKKANYVRACSIKNQSAWWIAQAATDIFSNFSGIGRPGQGPHLVFQGVIPFCTFAT